MLNNRNWFSYRSSTRTQVALSGRSKMRCLGLGCHLLTFLLFAALLLSACGASSEPASAPDEASSAPDGAASAPDASAPDEAASDSVEAENGEAAALEPAERNNMYDASP